MPISQLCPTGGNPNNDKEKSKSQLSVAMHIQLNKWSPREKKEENKDDNVEWDLIIGKSLDTYNDGSQSKSNNWFWYITIVLEKSENQFWYLNTISQKI